VYTSFFTSFFTSGLHSTSVDSNDPFSAYRNAPHHANTNTIGACREVLCSMVRLRMWGAWPPHQGARHRCCSQYVQGLNARLEHVSDTW